jgi:hypothetical protein
VGRGFGGREKQWIPAFAGMTKGDDEAGKHRGLPLRYQALYSAVYLGESRMRVKGKQEIIDPNNE